MTWLNWPNRITIARIILVAPLVICLLNLNEGWPPMRHLTFGLFVLMALSDGLDGFLARRLKEETPLGRFLDPIADKLLIACALILLATGNCSVPGFRLPSWVPVIAVGKDLILIIGFTLTYFTTGEFFIRPRIWGKTCTLIQSVLVGWTLLAPDLGPLLQRVWPGWYWLASGWAVVAACDYLRIGSRFAAGHQVDSRGDN